MTNEATIRVVLVLSVVFGWANQLVDVKGAFLCGNFQEEKPIYMKVRRKGSKPIIQKAWC